MDFILCEKPSVARGFAKTYDAQKKEGYFESNDYIVTYCFGHLLELYKPGDYDEKYKTWSFDHLPILPQKFLHKPNPKTKKQLSIIKSLLKKYSFDRVIIATDAGTEGELIGRLVLNYCSHDYSNTYRFWESESPTPPIIKKGMARLKKSSEYDPLYISALARSISDWIIGINCSRGVSISFGNQGTFSIGRVQTPLIKTIYDRHMQIINFQSETFFKLFCTFSKLKSEFTGVYEDQEEKDRFKDKETLLQVKNLLHNAKTGFVESIEKKKEKKTPPKLYDFTTLAQEANKKYGFTSQQTLDLCQSLYEQHNCLSYPRTPSRVMGEDDVPFVLEKIDILSSAYKELFKNINESKINKDNKHVFNNAKLEDHHALIPTNVLPQKCSPEEKKVYDLVLYSLAAVFSADYVYETVKAIIDVNGIRFKVSGKSDLQLGWKVFYTSNKNNKNNEDEDSNTTLPDLKKNEIVNVNNFDIKEGQTTPPKYFTEATLLDVMIHPLKYCKNKNVKFDTGTGLGTQATRPPIIEKLFSMGYIKREKKCFMIQPKGIFLIEQLEKCDREIHKLYEIETTARWQFQLKNDPNSLLPEIITFIKNTIKILKNTSFTQFEKKKSEKSEVGSCPLCKSPVYINSAFYYCSNKTCTFKISKILLKKQITQLHVKTLLSGKKTKPLSFISKKPPHNSFKAAIKLDEKGSIKFDFDKN